MFKYPRESFILRLGVTCSPSDRVAYGVAQKERGCGCRWAYGIYVSESGSNLLQRMVRAYTCKPGCGFFLVCEVLQLCGHLYSFSVHVCI